MKYDGHSELVKAAPKRLKDALELLEQPSRDKNGSDADYRHLCGAYYLAGYAVECALKVYIILLLDERNSARFAKWSDVIKHFQASSGQVNLTGAESHRLRRLCAIAELEPQIDSDQAMKETGASAASGTTTCATGPAS